ncbi:LptE family protein [Emticicia sp. 21SJ11W-3]|uniref:LptE family protein n=1 Tax=Emticicia sp. 21SJ11W-3 TaxID=2916755 RepID=UPI00209D32D3|nr:LptE family protein [Emticicia sp. 21SJ11W-3]UTA69763.1 LPS assembly lipoprotein LptE [Emticicia sp. 21SJ11W-3]
MNRPFEIKNRKITVFRKLIMMLCMVGLALLAGSCKIYSFSSAKLSEDLKTITIQNFVMNTAGGPANLTLTFTEKLKEYYQRNSNLKLKPVDGDLYLEGSIVGYELTPVGATASDKAAQNRLTIRVEVRFVNTKNEDESFEKEFSFYQDFSQEQTLTQVESALVPKILDQLVLNIFNDTAAQW